MLDRPGEVQDFDVPDDRVVVAFLSFLASVGLPVVQAVSMQRDIGTSCYGRMRGSARRR